MATRLDDYVSITITRQTAGITAPGFGVPLILGYSASWGDRLRYYQDLPSVEDDGFATDSPEYLAAAAILSQSPSVVQFAIGRGTVAPTLSYEIGATSAALTTYSVNAEGTGVTETLATFTTGASPNVGQIHNALVTQLNAVVGKNFTAALAPIASSAGRVFTYDHTTGTLTTANHGFLTGDGPVQVAGGTLPTGGPAAATNYWVITTGANTYQLASSLVNALAGTPIAAGSDNGSGTLTATPQGGALSPGLPFTVTGNAAGDWFSLTINDAALLTNVMDTSGLNQSQLTSDLNAIVAASAGAGGFYGLTTVFNSQNVVTWTAAWTESDENHIYCVAIPETAALASAYTSGSTEDTLAALRTANYTRTIAAYHQAPSQFMGAAWLGIMLPFQPGSATWKFKTLAAVDISVFSENQRDNLISRNGNGFESVAGLGVTFEGTCSDGEFMDAIVGDDWVKANMQAACFNVLATTPGKVPYEDSGVSLLVNAITSVLRLAQRMKIYALTPDITVTAGKAAAQPTVDKGKRLFQDIAWTATRSGAIHTLKVRGNVSL